MKKAKYILLVIFLLPVLLASAQSTKKLVRKGNKAYEKDAYSDAEVNYRKALEKKPGYAKGAFNLGDVFYQQNHLKEADSLFSEATATAKTSDEKAKAWYNKGNTLVKQKNYQKSIDAYKHSLLLQPDSKAAKYNLEYARKKLKKQKQQQKQQKKKKKNKKNKKNQKKDQKKNKQDQKKKKQNQKKQNQKKQNKQQQNQNKKKQNQQKQDQKKGDQKKRQQQAKPHQISKQDAKRMLDALKNGEKKTLQKLALQKAKAAHHKTKVIDW